MKLNLVVGRKGKLGSLLVQRAGFFNLDCDITDIDSIAKAKQAFLKKGYGIDVVVNCAGISSIDACEKDLSKAILVNVRGLHNLHDVFGERVLCISSDYVFNGNSWFLPNVNSKTDPVNNYGFSKIGAEAISQVNGGKVIRLSRSVSMQDHDILSYVAMLAFNREIEVPTFLRRNYLSRSQAVDGLEFAANNYDALPRVSHYGNQENVSMYDLLLRIAHELNFNKYLVIPRKHERAGCNPRPKWGGFKVSKGFPKYTISDTVSDLKREYNG